MNQDKAEALECPNGNEKMSGRNDEVVLDLNEPPSSKIFRKRRSSEDANENDLYKCNECNFGSDKRLDVRKHYLLEHSDK